jgi:hypothetical protein
VHPIIHPSILNVAHVRVFVATVLAVISVGNLWNRWMETPIKPVAEVIVSHSLFGDIASLVVCKPLFSSFSGSDIVEHIGQ